MRSHRILISVIASAPRTVIASAARIVIASALCEAILAAVSPCPAQTPPSAPLTAADAVELVLTNNPALEEARHTIDASRARADQSRSGYLPVAEAEASYVYLAPLSVFDLPGESIRVFPNSNYDGHVGVRQTLFDFQKTSSQVSLADARTVMAEDTREAVKRDLGVRAAETFYAILLLRRSIEVQNEQVTTLQEHLDITRKKAAAGTATQLDELSTQVRVAAAQNVKIGLENRLRDAETAFRALAVIPPGTPLEFQGDFTASVPSLGRDSLLKAGLVERIEAKSADDGLAAARAQQNAASASDAPSLNASVMYGFKNGYIPNIDVMRGNVVAAVDLHLPIFDGNRTRGMEEEATANYEAAAARKRQVDLMIQADIDQAIAGLNAASDRVNISETNINQADLAVKNARLRYEAGSLSNLDLLDAETELAQARLTNLQAQYDVVAGMIRLHRATGSPVVSR
ncbi:MAG TPA: TolC family protein [Bacteroidota bacterium]|nr:TolC family protein [Bacteroidota bacterium]